MRSLLLASVVAIGIAVCERAASAAETIRVGVAVSLKEAMTDVAAAYEKKTGDKVEFSFGSSGQILAQIKGGAPIDAFISAADKQVSDLVAAGLADADGRRVIAGNTLVLVVPRDSKVNLDSFESLGRVPIKRLALGEPNTVPAGQYAAQTLEKLKLTSALSDKIVYGANVRQVLDYVMRGDVTAGVVYATDAKQAGEKVKIVATAPEDSHDAIVYPAVVVKKSAKAAAAKRFLDYVGTDEARGLLDARGFTRPKESKESKAPPPAERRP
jgi:molybdate transport system substrate-binding protein